MNKIAQNALILLFFLPFAGFAAEVDDLYETIVPVNSQGAEERHSSLGDALSQVLVKVSGDDQVMMLPGMAELLGESSRLMQQYRYQTPESEQSNNALQGDGQNLWVRFDKTLVNKLLFENGLPVWGHTRPSVLLWVAVASEDGARNLLSSGREDPLNRVVEDVLKYRGIPHMLPTQDLDEQAQVGFIDVWGSFGERINEAAQRYQADLVVTARLFRDGAQWRTKWSVLSGIERISWDSAGDNAELALSAGLNELADDLARRYAQLMGEQEQNVLRLEVNDVGDMAGYVKINRYLASLSNVLSVEASQLSHQNIVFRVEIRGGREGVFQSISLGKTLSPMNFMSAKDATWRYRLMP